MANYIYASTRAKTLEQELLSESQRELLLGAQSLTELYTNLNDTFLAPYLNEQDGRVSKRPLDQILEQSITDAQKLLESIAPRPAVLEILWLKYDFYNLTAILKGSLSGMERTAIKDLCFAAGVYSPERLLQAFEQNALTRLDPRLSQAAAEANEHSSSAVLSLISNKHYLLAARHLADQSREPFVREYVSFLIDSFNIRAALRIQAQPEMAVTDTFVAGGGTPERLASVDSALEALSRLGGQPRWTEAIEAYHQHGDFSLLEKGLEDYLAEWLKIQSRDLFSPAPLFSYFTAKKNNVQLIRAIYVGRSAGMAESEIRRILRDLY